LKTVTFPVWGGPYLTYKGLQSAVRIFTGQGALQRLKYATLFLPLLFAGGLMLLAETGTAVTAYELKTSGVQRMVGEQMLEDGLTVPFYKKFKGFKGEAPLFFPEPAADPTEVYARIVKAQAREGSKITKTTFIPKDKTEFDLAFYTEAGDLLEGTRQEMSWKGIAGDPDAENERAKIGAYSAWPKALATVEDGGTEPKIPKTNIL